MQLIGKGRACTGWVSRGTGEKLEVDVIDAGSTKPRKVLDALYSGNPTTASQQPTTPLSAMCRSKAPYRLQSAANILPVYSEAPTTLVISEVAHGSEEVPNT